VVAVPEDDALLAVRDATLLRRSTRDGAVALRRLSRPERAVVVSDAAFKNEKDFTRWSQRQARDRGWLAGHLSNMQVVRMRDGNTRAIPDKNAAGFPDLVLVHPLRGIVVAELKMPGRKPDEAQLRWLHVLGAVGIVTYVWYPRDVDEIIDVLEGRKSSRRLFVEVTATS
jgi:hypothetical protein